MFSKKGIISEMSHGLELMWAPYNVWFLLREQCIPCPIKLIFMVYGSAYLQSKVLHFLKAAQLHNTLNVSFKVTMGNVTSSLSDLFLLNYAPLWQIICRCYARWIEFSVSASSLVNVTYSSQGYLFIPDGTRCSLCIVLPICGAYFCPKK